ncbi:MAG: HNH endonuclease signature motif containing protein [Acidobacteriota bacterium]
MASTVSAALRRLVAERAGFQCEYCLVHEEDTFYGCQVDHIISIKHRGLSEPENLPFACPYCNRSRKSAKTHAKLRENLLRSFVGSRGSC